MLHFVESWRGRAAFAVAFRPRLAVGAENNFDESLGIFRNQLINQVYYDIIKQILYRWRD